MNNTIADRKDYRKLKSIIADLNVIMSKIAGLEPQTERILRIDSYKIEEIKKRMEVKLSEIKRPL